MIAWWVGAAVAGVLPAEDLAALAAHGPPDRFERDPATGSWRATWTRGLEEPLVVELPAGSPRALMEITVPDGQREVWLAVGDGDEALLVRRAPCAFAAPWARELARQLVVPEVGDAAGEACPDGRDALEAYADTEPKVATLDVPLAAVTVTGRGGEPRLDVQRSLVGSRALLAHCFTSVGATGELTLRAVTGDGTLDDLKRRGRARVAAEVSSCVTERLDAAPMNGPPLPRSRVTVEVQVPGGAP